MAIMLGCSADNALHAIAAQTLGIQLWTVNESMQADPRGTLRQLQQMGYAAVESAGFGKLSAREFRKLLDDAGLKCPSAHLNFMAASLDAVMEDAKTLGVEFVVSSTLAVGTGAASGLDGQRAMTIEDAKRAAELANRIGERALREGMRYAYHNHAFEFVLQRQDAIAYDVLLQETDPSLVAFELDCGWMKVAGHEPLNYFTKYPQRFPLLHIKDFQPVDNAAAASVEREGAELGRGFIDYQPILVAARSAGARHYFVEQEGPFRRMTPMEAARAAYEYLRSMRT